MSTTQKWARGYFGSWLKTDSESKTQMLKDAYQLGTPECVEFVRLVAAHTAPVKRVEFS